MAVTNNAGRVHGIDGLRVVDASIFPVVPCANTNFPDLDDRRENRRRYPRWSLTSRYGRQRRSDPLNDHRRCHAAGSTHRHQAAFEIAAFELVEQGADQDRTGRTDRVAEGDRSAIDVDLVTIGVEIADDNFSATTANASLISIRSMSSSVMPALSSTLRAAGPGALSISVGESPTLAMATTRARGLSPCALA